MGISCLKKRRKKNNNDIDTTTENTENTENTLKAESNGCNSHTNLCLRTNNSETQNNINNEQIIDGDIDNESNKKKEDKIIELTKENEQLNKINKELNANYMEKINEYDILNKKYKEQEIKIKEKEINELKNENNKNLEKISDLKKNKDEKEKEIKKVKKQNKTNLKMIGDLNLKLKEKEKELQKVKNQNKNNLKKIDDLKQKINEKLQKEEKNSKKSNNQIYNNTNEISDLRKELKNILKKYNDLLLEKEPILVGLDNIGATCYMNATLQCLSNTYKLTNYFLKTYKFNEEDNNKLMSNEYYKVIVKLWDRELNNKSYSPYSFKNVLSKENPLFAGIQANDSKDLINFLLERFHKELNNINNEKIITNNYIENQNDQLDEDKMLSLFLKDFKNKYNSIISNLFYGVMETKSQCHGCQNIKYNFQIYSFLEFPLEQVNNYCFIMGKRNKNINNNKNPDIDLYECFEYYQKIDTMTGDNQMYCNICQKNCDAFYGTSLYSAPNFLIINLNRGKGAIYECQVNFPETLNLFNYVTYKNGNTVFELYAVICHIGPSSMSGHLWLFVKINLIKNGINLMILWFLPVKKMMNIKWECHIFCFINSNNIFVILIIFFIISYF